MPKLQKTQVSNKLIERHLRYSNQTTLAKFCDNYQVDRKISDYYKIDDLPHNYFTITTYFANGAFIEAETIQQLHKNDPVGIDTHYQVVNYGWGTK